MVNVDNLWLNPVIPIVRGPSYVYSIKRHSFLSGCCSDSLFHRGYAPTPPAPLATAMPDKLAIAATPGDFHLDRPYIKLIFIAFNKYKMPIIRGYSQTKGPYYQFGK